MKFKIFSFLIILLICSCKQEQQEYGISEEEAEENERMLKLEKCEPYFEITADTAYSQIDSIHFEKMNFFIFLKSNNCKDKLGVVHLQI